MLTQRDGAVLHAMLDGDPHPTIDPERITQLEQLVERVRDDRSIRALVFSSSAAGGFGIGVDLPALVATLGQPEVLQWTTRARAVFERIEALPVLTVGALHGVTFGGAFEWALCLDVLVAEKRTRFALPELRLGLIPGFGGYRRLCRRGGESLARELLLTGRSIGTRRAQQRGLLATVVPRGEGRPCALALANSAESIERDAMAAAKRLVQAGPSERRSAEEAVLRDRLAAPDTHELIQQTLNRSDPWKHLPPSAT